MTVEIGKQIKKFRQERDISQQELADYLKVSRQTISKWELGKSLPDLENVVRLSEYFNSSVDNLLGRKKSGFFRSLFEGKERRHNSMDQNKQENQNAAFYSAYTQELKPLFLEGKRVNTFVKIEDKLFPQATFSKLLGYANCLCSFSSEQVSIKQIGKAKVVVNAAVDEQIAVFPLQDIKEVNLQFGKYIRNVGGNFVTLIDIITTDQEYHLWVESLKVAHEIWHHETFASIKLNVDPTFKAALNLLNEEESVEAIRSQADAIQLFSR
ncbi:helix-turn-helix transcriptional regulator [Candidatus Enterococcus mansonii]|uniref:HTH cro/C1-type domain-containing protein n=1 Tax=Candidatus Enterococcus mansonii TaxID=1834181 RepID=A0A242CCN2_9ENTE|nr:helix-turn-helix transcriptional regulator [Enterococcus sp. 4G2_DIV0659]OTO08015.1 hypothetical protein A5880_002285 [Enterococcus sp. 4G2_DIV0659]